MVKPHFDLTRVDLGKSFSLNNDMGTFIFVNTKYDHVFVRFDQRKKSVRFEIKNSTDEARKHRRSAQDAKAKKGKELLSNKLKL